MLLRLGAHFIPLQILNNSYGLIHPLDVWVFAVVGVDALVVVADAEL